MLRTPIMQCVKQAERALVESEPNKEYLPIEGHKALVEKVGEMIFGPLFWKKERSRIAGFQTIGGTGALKIGGTFCKEEVNHPVFIPLPTWPNHRGVFSGCDLSIESYPYYDAKTHKLAFEAFLAFLEQREEGSIIVLHASCHNPTGQDPTMQQWKMISEVMGRKKLIPFFDCAYQGLGEGLDEDAQAVRLFAQSGLEMFVAFSAAKNFSLYGERVGALFILAESSAAVEHITSRVKQMIRTNYSNPPRHGAAVVAHILCDASLHAQWKSELHHMRERINHMRKKLADRLIHQSKTREFQHLKSGRGMFCVMGLDGLQVERLVSEYGIHMPRDGRINVCGLNQNNIDYVVDAIIRLT